METERAPSPGQSSRIVGEGLEPRISIVKAPKVVETHVKATRNANATDAESALWQVFGDIAIITPLNFRQDAHSSASPGSTSVFSNPSFSSPSPGGYVPILCECVAPYKLILITLTVLIQPSPY